MCKQDAKVELLGTLGCLHTFFFQDKREVVEKSGSAAEGWHGSHSVLRTSITSRELHVL